MARIEGVPRSKASLVVKLVYRFGPKMAKKMTGREPQSGSGIEPMEIWGYFGRLLLGFVSAEQQRPCQHNHCGYTADDNYPQPLDMLNARHKSILRCCCHQD